MSLEWLLALLMCEQSAQHICLPLPGALTFLGLELCRLGNPLLLVCVILEARGAGGPAGPGGPPAGQQGRHTARQSCGAPQQLLSAAAAVPGVTPRRWQCDPRWRKVAEGGGSVTPSGGSVTPDGGSVTPGGGSVTPDGGSVTPDGGSVTPGGGSGPQGGGSGILVVAGPG
ncbi:uncharacterized protein HaLaN_07082 [Haematococcus lacustris]|uniref:Uncharacterized protein n=1 Tax=Haematococcus lacustris TaxID=44745 RepID=A0A699YXJ3_HAELA|nr:uncharacterized protein HaLaN_07082 [Haematococcus lacustris]